MAAALRFSEFGVLGVDTRRILLTMRDNEGSGSKHRGVEV